MTHSLPIPILGFAAYSGTGKTTLLEALLPKLTQAGLRIGMLKHAHHDFDVDKEGKDSFRLRKAGASQMLIASRNRYALMTETPEAESEFDYLLSRFDINSLDVILVEGCKNIAFPKVELHREEVGKPWLYPNDDNIIAIAADTTVDNVLLPQMSINDIDMIARFVYDYVKREHQPQNNTSATSGDTLSPAFHSVEQGLENVLSSLKPIDLLESCSIELSQGRVLARDELSPVTANGAALSQGQRLASPEMGMLASLGLTQCEVYRRLKVAMFFPSDETKGPETKQTSNSMHQSNRFMLLALLEKLGCETLELGFLEGNEKSITPALLSASEKADVIISIGSISMGDTSPVQLDCDKLGKIDFGMRPEHRCAYGQVNDKPFFGLASHPIAVMVSFINVVEPSLRKIQGEKGWLPLKVSAVTQENLHSRQGQTEFRLGSYEIDSNGQLRVSGTRKQSSGDLQPINEANCLIEISPAVDTVKIGESVTIIPLQGRI
ncbi:MULTISPECIES: molybdopterin-guanine dinucleotide biosynthesis protein B [Vibrio]|uniref:molybdopterin-guanine dinucleotide biosynthesis protein B n=1 Tax=Vibrio TaxID=662 RepID=UPI002075EC38|nr:MULTISPECIES: molybdopterin-guanine dinucleotide biosynthesis protein B [Vibrio]USD31231.1 molybdopterin-guanine dinucleotide biosynthesis protein B [Vibrio sp. SCSIO 43186]USD44277.1 molybdopterin-guanine dinucleotide biosynthesis protein B [Vibrio sp. SCSIO 43145]USD68354.1 molybdopterin-guanine dinucleotide biosynthesis protein B [Vibrio sp. SCSIO 43139]USD96040.1 molybdopterin-guanine dinucleotide biosynthesis protein B [Vibrio coralliilyticus]